MGTGTFQRLTFGLVPVSADSSTRTMLTDFCNALGEKLGTFVMPHRAPSPLALASAFHAGRVHFGWFSPTLLATSPAISSATPLVQSAREGLAEYHAVLFVPADSRIRSIDDLEGAHVAWVSETSASGYLFPRHSLERQGIDPRRLFASERFYQSWDAAAGGLFDGVAEVGESFAFYPNGYSKLPLVRSGFDKAANGRATRVIDISGPIPADVIVASRGVSGELRAAATAALRQLCADPATGRCVRALFGVDSFETCGPAVLQSLRRLLATGAEADGSRVARRI